MLPKMKKERKDQDTIPDEILNQRAQLYAQVEDKIEIKGEIKEYLTFRLGQQWYMVGTHQLSEILEPQRISFLPRNKKFISGTMNVRGNIVLVADIKALLNIPEEPDHPHAKIILTRIDGDLTGFSVDEITGVQHIDTYKIKPAISTIHELSAEFINGLYQTQEKHFVLLNLGRLWLEMANKLGN
jgi:purine-binding chemotaxis protein CheW